MILNVVLLVVALVPFALIYLTKRYKWRLDGKYLDILATLVMTFLGAFLAIRLTVYENEKDQRTALAAILESTQWVCQTETRMVQLVLDSLDTQPEDYFSSFRSIESPSDPTMLGELLRNGDLYRYTSKRFRSLLPHLILSFRSLRVVIEKENRFPLEQLLRLLHYERDLLANEREFVTGMIGEEEVTQRHRSSVDQFLSVMQQAEDSAKTIVEEINRTIDSLKILQESVADSLRILEGMIKSHR
jgi:hypothetical protein